MYKLVHTLMYDSIKCFHVCDVSDVENISLKPV